MSKRTAAILFVAILLLGAPASSPATEAEDAPLKDAELFGNENQVSSRVTLISRSNGLQIPDMEEGNTELEVADINSDGHLDIVSVGDHGSPYVNSGEHGIMVWLGDGNGNWSVHQTGNFGYGGCAVGDLNLDGYSDVAWGIHHDWGGAGFGDTLMGAALGNGTGSAWTPWGTGLASNGETWGMFASALADFDGNGLLDIISQSFGGSNGLRLYRNNGDGTWTQTWALTGGSVGATLETCDVNADGWLDIVSTRSGSNVLLGDGSFGFTLATTGLPSGTIRGIHTGDINLDGTDDIVFAFGSTGVRCYTYRAGAWTSASTGLPTTGTYYLTQFGDIDGDGFLDIVVYKDPMGGVFLGDGAGNWTPDVLWTMPSPGEASALRVDGDVDHDGREDIAVLATKSGFPFYRNQLRVYSPLEPPAALTIQVTSPHGGETFRAGSIREIRWLTAVPAAQGQATVDIYLSHNAPSGPWSEVAAGLPDNGRYQWLVDGYDSQDCRIKVVATTSSASATAVSQSNFTMINDTVRLEADTGTISESAGGTVNFSLRASSANAGRTYIMLGTVSGTSPGQPLPGGMTTLPLNWDPFTKVVLSLVNSSLFSNFYSTLDAAGESAAQINSGPLPPGFVGVVAHFAYTLISPFNFVSNPVPIEIAP